MRTTTEKNSLSENCEALSHLDKLLITAKCTHVEKMCNFIAFADVPMSSHFIGDFVFGLSTYLFVCEISGNLSFCLLRSLTSFDSKVTTRISV